MKARAKTKMRCAMLAVFVSCFLAEQAHAQNAITNQAFAATTAETRDETAKIQRTDEPPVLREMPESRGTGFSHISDLFQDQKQIWTSPRQIRFSDATWLVPLGGITAGLFVADRQYAASLPQGSQTLHHYRRVSDAGIAGLAGGSASLYMLS